MFTISNKISEQYLSQAVCPNSWTIYPAPPAPQVATTLNTPGSPSSSLTARSTGQPTRSAALALGCRWTLGDGALERALNRQRACKVPALPKKDPLQGQIGGRV